MLLYFLRLVIEFGITINLTSCDNNSNHNLFEYIYLG